MNVDLFVSESSRGVHVPLSPELNFKLLSFTFLPSFSNLSSPVTSPVEVRALFTGNPKNFYIQGIEEPYALLKEFGGDLAELIVSLKNRYNSPRIFLAQDDDYQGNLMASLLYYHLLSKGVRKYDIIRMPLFDGGYDYLSIGLTKFLESDIVVEMLERVRVEREMMNVSPRIPAGFRKMYTMRYIEENRGTKVVRPLNMGSCTTTYLTKAMLNEK